MKIYNIHTVAKLDKYLGWKVPLLVETEQQEYTQTIVTEEDLNIDVSEVHQNETETYDGSVKENWDKYMTNITRVKTMSFEEYETVKPFENPSRFHGMYNPLTPMQNPQTEREKKSAQIILDTLQKLTPYIGRKIYIGKEGRCHYFMKPEAENGGIRMNCFLSISMKDI